MTLLDMVPVTDEQEAEALMFYHMKLAARLFEATGLSHKIPEDEFSHPAISAWLNAMDELYPE